MPWVGLWLALAVSMSPLQAQTSPPAVEQSPSAPARAESPAKDTSSAGTPSTLDERKRLREELERETREPLSEEGTGMGMMLLRTFVVLGVVVLSIYLTLNFGLRRMMGVKAPVGRGGLVSVVERVALDQRRALFVVKAAGEYLLVGGAEGGLTLLSKLSADEVDRITKEQQLPPSALSPFLQKLLSRKNPPS